MYGTSRNTLDLNTLFGTYIDEEYANLSGVVGSSFPAILTKTPPTIALENCIDCNRRHVDGWLWNDQAYELAIW